MSSGTRSDPPAAATWASRQRLSTSELLPAAAPGRKDSASILADARGPSPGAGLAQPGFAPARARLVPHLCVCWYSGSMSPAPPGPALASTEHVLTAPFRLPASGRWTRPSLPARAAPTHTLLVVTARKEKGNE